MERARAGMAAVLVVLGEPGVGKSALLDDLVSGQREPAGGFRVMSTAGVESESPLAFSALHRLLRSFVDFERLPVPQARALRVVFGLEEGPSVEPFLVGVATLSVLTEAAEREGPLLCVVDDAHWLDIASAGALLFAARRLAADRIAMVFAARADGRDARVGSFDPQGLTVLELGGIDHLAARRLLDERSGDSLSSEVAERLVRDSGGNPLALLELPAGLSPAQLHGAAPLPSELTLTSGLERAFLDRCSRLDEQVQTLLLVASVDATGRLDTIRAAASRFGVRDQAWEDAERARLLTVTSDKVAVRHALVRSAVHQAATSDARRQVHRALAEAIGESDPDRATWHFAASLDGPDADVADSLYQMGVRAEQRAGHDAAADAFERAAWLTVDGQARATRLFSAARNAWTAGDAARARELSSTARHLVPEGLLRADIDRLRARIEVNVGSAVEAHRIFNLGVRRVAHLDPARALEMATAAALTRIYGGDSGDVLPADVLAGLMTATDVDTPRTECLKALLDALTESASGAWQRAAAQLTRASELGRLVEDPDVLGNLGNAALYLGDDEGATFFYSTMVSNARHLGAGMSVTYGLQRLAFIQFSAGRWTALRNSAEEALALARAVGQPILTAAPLGWLTFLAAMTDSDTFDDHLRSLESVVAGQPLGILSDPVHDITRWAKATRATSLGDSAGAVHHLSAMRLPALQRMATVDRIEAAIRGGARHQALGWLDDLAPFAIGTNRPWALADLDFGRAVCATDAAEAADAFESALGHHEHANRPFNQARTRLAYGEFLRRSNRRVDSRTHLRSALETFTDLGAVPLTERAGQELRASGETARKRDPSTLLDLTPMERKVAQLVSTGLSNKEAAAQCWVSPRTVAFHLRNVFLKAGVTSRTELAQLDFG